MIRKALAVKSLKKRLESRPVEASAPCRIDCGGTLDIKTFHFPLRHLSPCTFNIALDMKTWVRLLPWKSGEIMVSSNGFDTEVHPADNAPFDGPLGLVFAIASYFRVEGVHIEITSKSPPRSALGGSSTAAVAIIGALSAALMEDEDTPALGREQIVLLAHALEEAVAGIPCGMQDQLAALYGGVHAWYWPGDPGQPPFRRTEVVQKEEYASLERHLLVAYCGVPHESQDINTQWTKQFIGGRGRHLWPEIISCTKQFVDSISAKDWSAAAWAINREVEIRRKMTPEVFDETGVALHEKALGVGCGARFAGAGGGGCLWALGEAENIVSLSPEWLEVLSMRKDARLLHAKVDPTGLKVT